MAYDEARHQRQIKRLGDATAGLTDSDGGLAIFEAQMAASMDMAVAQMIRNDRSGTGKGLRASGMTETADLLGL